GWSRGAFFLLTLPARDVWIYTGPVMSTRILPLLCCFLAGAVLGFLLGTFRHPDPSPAPEGTTQPTARGAWTVEVADLVRPDGEVERLPVKTRLVLLNPDSITTVDVTGVRH